MSWLYCRYFASADALRSDGTGDLMALGVLGESTQVYSAAEGRRESNWSVNAFELKLLQSGWLHTLFRDTSDRNSFPKHFIKKKYMASYVAPGLIPA
jgi:hypothetical protein